ncbi:glycosyltransferase [Paraflavitalea sp. sgz302552]|uniref:glycosyltransferase n=1 Tax=Paraflavitalea sp. sgz302552 TaxID=3423908 RepID=UPI003D33D6F1
MNIKFLGPVPPHELDQLYKKHHIFALPTQGENFGHAIFDAFCNGKPVVISDQTPWTQLAEHHAGWEIPLSQKKAFISCLQQAIDWNHSTYKEWSNGAHQLAVQFVAGSNINDQYKKLFF